jgi:hypothetical protein
MAHRDKHPEPQPDCFGCKAASINWGIVPGAYRDVNSKSMFDRDALPANLPTREETEDRAATARRKIREASAEV